MGSSFSSTNSSQKHDVFLSFRGVDTRNKFRSHLKADLVENRIKTFTDDEDIKIGEPIGRQLLQAIEDSRCSIIIFSPQYASSTWCLIELVKILDCMKTKGQIVIPIFYRVDRSDVRHQTGSFGEAFARLWGDPHDVQSWRNALNEVAGLDGFDYQEGDEADFIRKIVEEVSSKLGSNSSSVASSNIPEGFSGINSPVALARVKSYLSWWLAGIRNMLFTFFFFSNFVNRGTGCGRHPLNFVDSEGTYQRT